MIRLALRLQKNPAPLLDALSAASGGVERCTMSGHALHGIGTAHAVGAGHHASAAGREADALHAAARERSAYHAVETRQVAGGAAHVAQLPVIATAKAKPGKEGDLEAALREVADPTRAQAGCVAFSLYRSKDAKGTIIGFERWASAADHQKHLQGAHVQRLMGRMANILAEAPSIVAYEVIDES